MKTKEEIAKIVDEALKKALNSTAVELSNGTSPRFALKHALRLQGLFLQENDEITNANGKLYATLESVIWKDQNILESKIKIRLNEGVKFFITTIDIGSL